MTRNARLLALVVCALFATWFLAEGWRGATNEARPITTASRALDEAPRSAPIDVPLAREPVAEESAGTEELPVVPVAAPRVARWVDCVEDRRPDDDVLALRTCLEEALDDADALPAPSDLAAWLCSTSVRAEGVIDVLRAVFARVPAHDVLAFASSVGADCDGRKFERSLEPLFGILARDQPGWRSIVTGSLTANLVFDPERGSALARAASALAEGEGGEWARQLLREGGLGAFGGSDDQIEWAVNVTLHLDRVETEANVDYVASVLDSPLTGANAGVGSVLVHHLLLDPVDPDRAIAMAHEVLADPRFGLQAAAQVLAEFGSKPAPAGAADGAWERLLEAARVVDGG